VAIAKQDTGRTYLGILLLSQQAEKLVKGKFTSDLKQLASDTPIDTEEYRLEVREADTAKAVMVAIAKKPGFASYTGAVYAVEGNIPVTGMCRTNVPSQVPPTAPKFTYSTILCAQGSSKVN
jgi:Type IV pilin-like G and H, putative